MAAPSPRLVRAGQALAGLARAGLALAGLALATAAVAQDVALIPRDTFTDKLHREGNSITFCYNADGMMAAFDQDLARVLGEAMLVEVKVRPMPATHIDTPPFDHRLPVMPEQLFMMMAEGCSAVLGYALTSGNPDWLLVTRPYLEGRMVLVTRDPALARLQDLPLDRPIGTRSMTQADNRLINYLQAQPEARRWRRFAYFSNDVVLDRLGDGTIGLGLVWEPALHVITGGDPRAAGFRVLASLPFEVKPIEIGIATRSQDTWLNTLLGDGIATLIADGTLDTLLQAHHLQPAEES